jgi:hypothetical protein
MKKTSAIIISFALIAWTIFISTSLAADFKFWTFGTAPNETDENAVQISLRKGDVDGAEQQIQSWLDGHNVNWVIWYHAFPAMAKIHHEQKIVDMTISALNSDPWPETAETILEWRIKALLLMNKPMDALEAAKSYYNICRLKQTPRAVEVVGLCLTQANPEDTEIADRFRHEQAVQSQIGAGAATQPADSPQALPLGAKLKSVVIDAQPYEDGLAEWSGRGRRFEFQRNDADLLLAADKATEAETIFRDLFSRARTQEQIDTANEGIARSLRAEDGNLARANAYLKGK